MERRTEEDDPELVLPPLDGDDDDQQPVAPPAGNADLDLDTLGDNEEVGLDADSGGGDHFDLSELIGASDRDESEQWTPDSEAAEELEGADPEVMQGEEEGWTEDSEAAEDGEYEVDGMVFQMPPDASQEDGGEEGVNEAEARPIQAGEDDETTLPPLNSGGEEEEDDDDEETFGRELLDEMADGGVPEE